MMLKTLCTVAVVAFLALAAVCVWQGRKPVEHVELDPALRETTPKSWWAAYARFEEWFFPAALLVVGVVLLNLGPAIDHWTAERTQVAQR